MKPVYVTGVGAVSACGIGAEALWAAARDGISAVRPIVFPDIARQQVHAAAALAEADLEEVWKAGDPRTQDRVSALALAAAREAVAQAGLTPGDLGHRCCVIVGSGFGGAQTIDRNSRTFWQQPATRLDPFSVPKIMPNAPASWISMEFGANGPAFCVSSACSSASQAIGFGLQMLRAGTADVAIVGGVEALLVPSGFRAWEILRVMSPTLCRPFSQGRDGMVLGDGAGILVLETEDRARARGTTPLARLAGFATNSDARDLLRPDAAMAACCMREAIADAGLSEADIGYVNAHGTGTVANDANEGEALRSVFGDECRKLAISSTKPVHGHTLGAAGAIEAIVALGALRDGIAPPTLNFAAADPKIGIEPLHGTARRFSGAACLSNSFAFGGINACLVFSRGD